MNEDGLEYQLKLGVSIGKILNLKNLFITNFLLISTPIKDTHQPHQYCYLEKLVL